MAHRPLLSRPSPNLLYCSSALHSAVDHAYRNDGFAQLEEAEVPALMRAPVDNRSKDGHDETDTQSTLGCAVPRNRFAVEPLDRGGEMLVGVGRWESKSCRRRGTGKENGVIEE